MPNGKRVSTGLLGRWLADPLPPEHARDLLARAATRERRLAAQGRGCRTCALMRLAARFWLGEGVSADFEHQLAVGGRHGHFGILLQQLYGQLLMSRQQAGAHDHLEAAFRLAHRLYTPGDYFLVLRRNTLLRHLPLSPAGQPPQSLERLLTSARVAAELQRRRPARPTIRGDRGDTFG